MCTHAHRYAFTHTAGVRQDCCSYKAYGPPGDWFLILCGDSWIPSLIHAQNTFLLQADVSVSDCSVGKDFSLQVPTRAKSLGETVASVHPRLVHFLKTSLNNVAASELPDAAAVTHTATSGAGLSLLGLNPKQPIAKAAWLQCVGLQARTTIIARSSKS